MDEEPATIIAPVESGDTDRVNDLLERLEGSDQVERGQLFDACFDELVSIYETSEDGYVRQSVVRVVEVLSPGLAVAFNAIEGDIDVPVSAVERRLDTATGFLLDAIQDGDGRVRHAAQRALKNSFRAYETLEDTETIVAIEQELDAVAPEYEGSRREHILEARDDAEYFGRSTDDVVSVLHRLAERAVDR